MSVYSFVCLSSCMFVTKDKFINKSMFDFRNLILFDILIPSTTFTISNLHSCYFNNYLQDIKKIIIIVNQILSTNFLDMCAEYPDNITAWLPWIRSETLRGLPNPRVSPHVQAYQMQEWWSI